MGKILLTKKNKGSLTTKDFKKIKNQMNKYHEKQMKIKLKTAHDMEEFDVERDLHLYGSYDELLKMIENTKLAQEDYTQRKHSDPDAFMSADFLSNVHHRESQHQRKESRRLSLRLSNSKLMFGHHISPRTHIKKTKKKPKKKRVCNDLKRNKKGNKQQKSKTNKKKKFKSKSANKMPTQYLHDQKDLINKMQFTIQRQTRKLGDRATKDATVHTFGMRKQYNVLKAETRKKERRLKELESELSLIYESKSSLKDDNKHCDEAVKKLKMELDTVLLHIIEMSENTKTFEMDISFMIEEKMERAWQMESIKKEMQEVNALCGKIKATARACDIARSETEQSLAIFEEEIETFRPFFNRRIKDLNVIWKSIKNKKTKKKKRGKVPTVRDRKGKESIASMKQQFEKMESKLELYEGL